jgi:hypothetical protein
MPNKAGLTDLMEMGAEVLLVPPERCSSHSGAVIEIPNASDLRAHKAYTQYELCGPEPIEQKAERKARSMMVATMSGGSFQATPSVVE